MKQFLKYSVVFSFLILFLLLNVKVTPAVTGNLICDQDSKGVVIDSYINSKRGKVITYVTPIGYKPSPPDLVCATIKQFWVHKKHFPKKLTVIVTSKDFLTSLLLQVNLNTDSLLITTVNIPNDTTILKEGSPATRSIWLLFPSPMTRITEMIRQSVLPMAVKGETKANYVVISQRDIMFLVMGHKRERYLNSGSIIIGQTPPQE